MSEDRVRTNFVTENGTVSVQEYFVREHLAPALQASDIRGGDSAQPTPEVKAALAEADLVVIGPSNPLISIAPILKVVGRLLRRERTVAVTPIVGGAALKGPTIEMLRALGFDASPGEVARIYQAVARTFGLDSRHAGAARSIEAMDD